MALDSGVSHPAFRLASILLHYESADRGCFPAQRTLARHLGCSLDTVQRYLEELERYGFLVREKTRGRSNRYLLEPLYEPPIPHDSVELTAKLQAENTPARRPPSPRTLRKSATPQSSYAITAASKTLPAAMSRINCKLSNDAHGTEVAAPVRSVQTPSIPAVAARMRHQTDATSAEPAAPVRPEVAAPHPSKQPHRCGPIKNVSIKNQQQDAVAANLEGTARTEKIALVNAALRREGVSAYDAETWGHSLVDLEIDAVVAATRILFTKPAYRRGEIRTPAAYLRALCKTVVAADRRLAEHEELKRSGVSTPGATAMEIFATLNREDQERVVTRACSFAQPNAALWPLAVAVALNVLHLSNNDITNGEHVEPA